VQSKLFHQVSPAVYVLLLWLIRGSSLSHIHVLRDISTSLYTKPLLHHLFTP
jgi:hypothetical protein